MEIEMEMDMEMEIAYLLNERRDFFTEEIRMSQVIDNFFETR